MPSRTALTAALLIVLAVSAGTARADIVAASNLSGSPSYARFFLGVGFAGGTPNGPFTNETPAQEFTASAGGLITTLTATIGQSNPQGIPLTVTISQAAGSIPGAALGSETFTTAQVSSNPFTSPTTFDLSAANINLVTGLDYFVTFTVATPINKDVRYEALLLNSPNPIALGFPPIDSPDGGATWLSSTIPDEIGLTVRVGAVPEPSSLALFGLGAAALALVRARRRRLSA